MRLNQLQKDQLFYWIAQDLTYKQMVKLMDEAWGGHIESPGVSYYRDHHAAEIQQKRIELQDLERRRKRDRDSKQRRRSGLAPHTPHCATCQCQTIARAG